MGIGKKVTSLVKRLAHHEDGFTLLEVMIAMAILALAMGSIIGIEASSINASTRAKQMNVVAMLAKNMMMEAEFKIHGRSYLEMKTKEEGKFPEPYDQYTWRIEVKELKFPTLANPNNSEGGEQGGPDRGNGGQSAMGEMITRVTSNFLSKAIRELSVTILWKERGNARDFTLATYWVDLNHEFTISE